MVTSHHTRKDKVSALISWGHWFSFFNILAAMAIGIRYVLDSEWPSTLLGQTYLTFSWLGHFAFLVFGFYILILFPLSFLIPSQRIMRVISVIFATMGLTALILDSYAYQTLSLHLSPLVWELLLSGEKTELNTRWQYLFVIVPMIFLLQLILSEIVWRRLRSLSRRKLGAPIAWFFGVCFLCSHLIYIWADANLYHPVTMQRSNFPLSYPMTAKRFMERHGLLDKATYMKLKAEQGISDSPKIHYPLVPLTFNHQESKDNVLMIMVDGLRADTVTPNVMPFLSDFAKNNIQFTQHYSASNNNIDGLFGLFYSLPSTYIDSIRASKKAPIFISTLERHDYHLGLFSSDQIRSPKYYQMILGHELNHNTANITEKSAPTDQKTLSDWNNWLNKQDETQPWFGFVELTGVANFESEVDSDPKFTPSLGSNQEDNVQNNTTLLLKNSYLNSANHVDNQIKRIITTLKADHRWKNTVIVITSNHGTEFNDTGSNNWGANNNYSAYQLHVPFIMHWPNHTPRVISELTSHLDFVPTLMKNLLHCTSPIADYSTGINLFNQRQTRQWVLAGNHQNIAVIQPDRTTVIDQFGNYRIYNQNYRLNDQAKPKLSVLIQVLHEVKRFDKNE
jgi:hypothetical protein